MTKPQGYKSGQKFLRASLKLKAAFVRAETSQLTGGARMLFLTAISSHHGFLPLPHLSLSSSSPNLPLRDPTHPLSDSSMDIPCTIIASIQRPLVTNDAFIGVIEMNCTDTLLPPNLKSHNAPVEWGGETRKMRQFFSPCVLGIHRDRPSFLN